MAKRISRRQFLKLLAATSGAAITTTCGLFKKPVPNGKAWEIEGHTTYMPYVTNGPQGTVSPPPPPAGARVVHIYNQNATSWTGNDPHYWNYVNQNVVDNMVDRGMLDLTGASSVTDAWRALLPEYQPGQGIAIKVNFNNAITCDTTDGYINSIAEPVNAVIRGLKQIGVSESDIWIFDAIRAIPNRFVSAIPYGSVRYFDKFCRETAGFNSNDPNAFVTFSNGGVPANRISDVLINATYLINMPLMKRHGIAAVSLAFKHHFGTIDHPRDLHNYIRVFDQSNYSSSYSPIVDIYRNPHISGKTILTIGDGLFTSSSADSPPILWGSLGNETPNSLFFANDPVAADCVMCDVLNSESPLHPNSDDYMRLASEAGLGVFERGTPWGSAGYNLIDYRYVEL